jgi:hypothetical protein
MGMCPSLNEKSKGLDTSHPLCMSKKESLFSYSRSMTVRAANDFEKNKKI